MKNVIINGHTFVPYISNDKISEAIRRNAREINSYYEKMCSKDNTPLFISVLNGAYMYTADLLKELDFPCEVSFIKAKSYCGLNSTENIMELIGLDCSIKGRDVIVLDDIIDTGCTMKSICENLSKYEPRSIKIGALFYKPNTVKCDLKVDFPTIIMQESAFIIGYGLDYDGLGRNLKDVYILK